MATPTCRAAAGGFEEAEESDTFDAWEAAGGEDGATFVATDQAHEGRVSLLVLDEGTKGAKTLAQPVAASPGELLTLSFHASADGGYDKGLTVGVPEAQVSLRIPAGADDILTAAVRVPAGVQTVRVVITARGMDDDVQLDSFSLTDGTGVDRLRNGGFEVTSADLTVTNDSLLFSAEPARIELSTRRSGTMCLDWVIVGRTGSPVAAGSATAVDGAAAVEWSHSRPGYYELQVTADLGDRRFQRAVAFGVLAASVEPTADSPFGVTLSIRRPRVASRIAELAALGVRHVRVDASWSDIEKTPGVYTYPARLDAVVQSLADEDIDVLLVAGYRNPLYDSGRTPSSAEGIAAFAAYAADLARHFAGESSAIDVYNEFDYSRFNDGACGGSADCYLPLLEATAAAVRKAEPDTLLSAPNLSGYGIRFDWLERFFSLGGLRSTDVVSVHPYPEDQGAPELLEDQLERLRDLIRSHTDEPTDVWLTETGWSTSESGVSDSQQAAFLVRSAATALGGGASRVYWYEVADKTLDTDDLESNFGLFRAPRAFVSEASEPKPGAVAQAVLARQLSGGDVVGQDDLGDDARSYRFDGGSAPVRVMWTTSGTATVQVVSGSPLTVVSVDGSRTVLEPRAGVIQLELTTQPVYLEGEVEDLWRS